MTGSFRNIERFPKSMSIDIPLDADGYLGRECPQKDCEGYFKIRPTTSKRAEGGSLHCAYCGHCGRMDSFWSKAQIEYAKSIALRMFTDALHKDLKSFEFEHKPQGLLGIGISLKVEPHRPVLIRHYQEESLETAVACENCGLEYSVFGVFAFCPDCGSHNSTAILKANMVLVAKQVALAKTLDDNALVAHLIEDALENCVSSFDGFGRELARLHSGQSSDPEKAKCMSFQNLERAARSVSTLFGVDLKSGLRSADWQTTHIAFMRRHLIAHKSGVIDQQYLKATGESASLLGRRVRIDAAQVDRGAL